MDNLGKLFGDSKNEFLSSIPNIFNNKEDIVLNSKKVSFYKGVPVYRVNLPSSFSFAAIFWIQTMLMIQLSNTNTVIMFSK